MLNTPLGIRVTERAWVRGKFSSESLAKAFLEQDNVKTEEDPLEAFKENYFVQPGNPEVIIMPMFNDLLGGLPVNTESPKSLLGPLFRTNAVNMDDFDVYSLDGTYLGKVGFLRRRLES
jgi:metallophosphoesterase superfamily enzyme